MHHSTLFITDKYKYVTQQLFNVFSLSRKKASIEWEKLEIHKGYWSLERRAI